MKRPYYIAIIILEILIVVPALLFLHFNYFTSEKYSYREEELIFKSGNDSIYGILTLPQKPGVYPAIVLLHGSDRGTADNYKEYAVELVKSGYAIFRYDSPGKGKSTGNTFGETFEQRVKEALAAINLLQSNPKIDAENIGLWGISQGGWICQIAAAKSEDVAFIIPVSGPGVSVPEQEIYRVEAESRASGFSEEEIKKAVLIRRLLVDIVLSVPKYKSINKEEAENLGEGPWNNLISIAYPEKTLSNKEQLDLLIQSLEEINQESWSRFIGSHQVLPMIKSIPPDAFESVKRGMESTLLMNPEDYLKKIKVPVLALFGEADTSIPVEKSVQIYTSNISENLTINIFPGASHVITVNNTIHSDFYPITINWLKKLKTKNLNK